MSTRRAITAMLVVPCLVVALAGCGPSAGASATPRQTPTVFTPPTPGPQLTIHWQAPADPMGLTVDAGLVPETSEYLAFHVHVHLDVFIDGEPIQVPAGIGIDTESPDVGEYPGPLGIGYGDISVCAQPCISPLHTHDPDGIIHTESATPTPNTLGQFFIEWDVELSETCVGEFCSPDKPVAFYVDGVAFTGDPREIELSDRKEIAIVIGTPPAVIPSTGDFSGA